MKKVPKQKPDKEKKLREDKHKQQVAIEKDRQMKIKHTEKVEKELALEKVAVKTGKYRYSCDGCTKIAFWASYPQNGDSKVCPHCSKALVTSKSRYILD